MKTFHNRVALVTGAALAMLDGVRDNLPYIIFPGYNRLLVKAYRLAPDWIGRPINKAF